MSDVAVVRCPSCSQKYRVKTSTVGRRARCKQCGTSFKISQKPVVDEDTIFGWMTDDDPASESVMGGTSIVQSPTSRASVPPGPVSPLRNAPSMAADVDDVLVHLERINTEGAHFVFPAAMLTSEPLRNAFPRKCVGCGTKIGLNVHLLRWPERMPVAKADGAQADDDASPIGRLEAFDGAVSGLIAQLPTLRDVPPPFNLPFPLFCCDHCHLDREVTGHVISEVGQAVCRLTIASLAVAVGFFRNCGGRSSPDYHRLIETRDQRYDAWKSLDAAIRERLQQWFTPQSGERFVNFFCDEEFTATQAGISGMVLTDRRLVFKKYAACRDFALTTDGRMEIRPQGTTANVSVFEEGHRPVVVKLDHSRAEELATNLRTLGCTWTVVQ